MLAPVVLFVYNRCDHLEKTLEALSKNTLAKESDLYIFSDGAKNEKVKHAVENVRQYINSDEWKGKFKSITIIESKENKGLANSIISGVSKVMEIHEKAIVIEDDAVTAPDFLEFMNNSLDFYEHSNKIWAISGYTVLKTFPKDYLHEVFMLGRFSSYAWATWKKNWEKVDWSVSDYKSFCTNFKQRRKFNRYGQDLSLMLDSQVAGKTNSWAIRFDYAMFKNKMYSVYPCKTRVKNIGYDVGTHVTKKNTRIEKFKVEIEKDLKMPKLEHIEEDSRIVKAFSKYFKKNLLKRCILYIKVVGFNLIKVKRGSL